MNKITIIGWQPRTKAVVEIASFWPLEMDVSVAIARASREADVETIESVLVERDES